MSTTTTISNQATAEWVKIFPKMVTSSYTSSVTFMKQLTVIAVSTVSYLKDIFPEDNFKVESFGGYKIRILKDKCTHELAQFVSTSLIQAFEAFDKQYLQKLVLCFYDGSHDAQNLVEYYLFEYSYNPAGVNINVHTKTSKVYTFDDIRDKTVLLIKTCVIMAEASKKIDLSIADVSLRLYYNENAPENYQAPGYLPSSDAEDHLVGKFGTISSKSVQTPYHRLKMSSYIRKLLTTSEEVIASGNTQKLSDDNFYGFDDYPSGKSVHRSDTMTVRCFCNNQDEDVSDSNLLIMCNYCSSYQHAICYGICRSDVSRVFRHCCAICHDKDPTREPTDIKFANIAAKQRASVSILRRTLDWCCEMQEVSVNDLIAKFRISQQSAVKLMKVLDNNGIFARDPDEDLTTSRKIIAEKLKSAVKRHFQTEKYNIVERLVAESLFQEQNDPVGDTLGPLETMSLRNATTLGRVLDVNVSRNVPSDPTLKQYREAMLLQQDNADKPPLSGTHKPIQDNKKPVKRKSTSGNKLSKSGVKTKKLK